MTLGHPRLLFLLSIVKASNNLVLVYLSITFLDYSGTDSESRVVNTVGQMARRFPDSRSKKGDE